MNSILRHAPWAIAATLLVLLGTTALHGQVKIYTKEAPPPTPKLEDLPLKESVTQYGITWTFDKPTRVGQFVNGDYYVVGDTTIKMIDPKPLWGDEVKEKINKDSIKEDQYAGKQARHGSSLNPPSKAKTAGFDSRIPSERYDPALFTPLPIKMKAGDSLVSTISRDNSQITKFGGQHVDPLKVAAVLTCVAEPLPGDAFRPSYTDSKNSKLLLARNLRRELLLKLPRPEKTPADLAAYAAKFQKPWIDLADFGFAAPQENLPHYGQQMVEDGGEATLLLLMDYPAEQKETLLVNYVQVGIDLFGVARGGFVWQAHGGLNSGRKWPIVFAGLMLGDEAMQTPEKAVPGLKFGEDEQTTFGPVTYRGQTFDKSWTGAKVIFKGHSPYLIKPTKEAEDQDHWPSGWGLLDVYPPTEWPLKERGQIRASEGYRRANTSASWVAQTLAARILRAEKAWNHEAFFAYVDRWMTEDDTKAVEAIRDAGFADYTKAKPGMTNRQGNVTGGGNVWVRKMWAAYRNNLPPMPGASKTPNAEETWK
jgi:hypothetical protein